MTTSNNGERHKWPVIWSWIRQVVTFTLGVAVIVDSLVEKNTATVGRVGCRPIADWRSGPEDSSQADETKRVGVD